MAKHILFVVTSCAQINEEQPTGIWLSEFAEPYEVFKQQGYQITVASIRGGQAPIDPRSLQKQNEQTWSEAVHMLAQTKPIEEIVSSGYDAIFLPGGHGTMFDLPDNARLQQLLREFAESNRVIAAVCHGPAGLIHVTLSNGQHLLAGKRVTAFTNEEERAAKFDSVMPFLLEDAIREAGAQFVTAPLWANHVERDGQLITGQNPQSGEAAAREVVKLLEENR